NLCGGILGRAEADAPALPRDRGRRRRPLPPSAPADALRASAGPRPVVREGPTPNEGPAAAAASPARGQTHGGSRSGPQTGRRPAGRRAAPTAGGPAIDGR